MKVTYGKGKTTYGPGVDIELTGDEVAVAIDAYLVAHGVHVNGPRTITVNGELCKRGKVYVDPSGFVISDGKKWEGQSGVNVNTKTGRLRSDRPNPGSLPRASYKPTNPEDTNCGVQANLEDDPKGHQED